MGTSWGAEGHRETFREATFLAPDEKAGSGDLSGSMQENAPWKHRKKQTLETPRRPDDLLAGPWTFQEGQVHAGT